MSNLKLIKIIEKKRLGEVLTADDIQYFVHSVVESLRNNSDSIQTDFCQIGAMLMAMYLKGLNSEETYELMDQMRVSGEVFTWPEEYRGLIVDKHSTGGVGDKVSLILAPALAALGYKVPMISGRSLKHTGGTLDKLESIPGLRVLLSREEIYKQIELIGCCIVGQTSDCCPADSIIYKCREITATVDNPPFIIASILSKKLSEGLDSLVLDIKYGRGSMFRTKDEALETAKRIVEIAKSVKTSALLTSMENPLGNTIGNTLEVMESVECLQGGGPQDVLEVTKALGAEIISLTKGSTMKEAKALLNGVLEDGRALKKFHEMLVHQGVSEPTATALCYSEALHTLPKAPFETCIAYVGEDGYVSGINPLALADLWKEELEYSNNNPGVGFTIIKKVGEEIKSGDIWLKMHHVREISTHQKTVIQNCISVSLTAPHQKLIDKRIFCNKFEVFTEEYESV